ncbi:hypothetical protein DFH29DRAFT_994698 [Suillus ampliporus]|nr:hypothetical protein DFH29DRAFT_994698 [Suillus ampliporus]
MSNKLKLYCWVLGDDSMRRDRISFINVDANDLDLWKVKIKWKDLLSLTIGDEGGFKPDCGVKLDNPMSKLSGVFTDGVEQRYVHIVVRLPTLTREPAVTRGFGTRLRVTLLTNARHIQFWAPSSRIAHSTLDDDQFLQIGRVLYALRESIAKFKGWYDNVFEREEPPYNMSHPVPHSRFFPTPDTYIRDCDSYINSPPALTYLAETVEAKPINVLVKFVTRYGEDAHKAMAEAGFAPKILYYGPINIALHMPSYGRVRMVVMEYVDGKTAFSASNLPFNFHQEFIEYCHGQGFVFGDLRMPNVMVTKNGKMQLIDFDCAGREGEVTYPISISSDIDWPEGVRALKPILKRHNHDHDASAATVTRSLDFSVL